MFLLWYKFTKINGNVSDIIIFPEAGYITERSNLQIYRHIICKNVVLKNSVFIHTNCFEYKIIFL